MRFPKLQTQQASREVISIFRGWNAAQRIGEGEFSAMENMSSDAFPLLSTRKKRGVYAEPASAQGLIARDGLCWVDGSKFVMNGYPVELNLSTRAEDCPKTMVSMGAYVIIFPDKKYINTLDTADYGNLEAEFSVQGTADCIPAAADGSPLNAAYVQPEAPESPGSMALWLDTSVSPNALMQWSSGSAMWVDVEATYVKISAPNIGKAFRAGDGVTIAGAPAGVPEHTVVRLCGDGFLLVDGLLAAQTSVNGLTVSRKLPLMDYVIECGNRLWGCRYGANAAGEVVNEIYASKLGDFRNWNCFEGIATDSYAVSLGDDGPFTGAIQHLGYPVFFRENAMHRIYGNYPANFRLQTTPCRGVQKGSAGSLAIVGEVLYYKSATGICAFDGALPTEVSRELGSTVYTRAVAGACGGKYYISMADAGGEYHLFVYDTARNLWHREDSTRVRAFCTCREELYFLDGEGRICTVSGGGTPEASVSWMVQTGDLGLDSPDNKYLARLTLRLRLEPGAEMTVSVRYDEETQWHTAARIQGTPLGSVTLPLGVRRCDHLRLRLEGSGEMRLYSLAKTIVQGSDVF